jgi:hypothetical protein
VPRAAGPRGPQEWLWKGIVDIVDFDENRLFLPAQALGMCDRARDRAASQVDGARQMRESYRGFWRGRPERLGWAIAGARGAPPKRGFCPR